MRKVCLVTGGSRGIGRSIAIELAAKGACVVVNYASNADAAMDTLALLPTCDATADLSAQRHAVMKADLASPDACQGLIENIVKDFGRIDVLVNNAGICVEHDVLSVSYAQWQQIMKQTLDVNFFGASNLSFLAVQQFVAQDREGSGGAGKQGGRIVNITSRAAYRGELTASGYAASKAPTARPGADSYLHHRAGMGRDGDGQRCHGRPGGLRSAAAASAGADCEA